MRKSAFCICENRGADQLHGNCGYCAADQHLCFRYLGNTIPLLPKCKISSLWPSSVAVQPGFCGTYNLVRKYLTISFGSTDNGSIERRNIFSLN